MTARETLAQLIVTSKYSEAPLHPAAARCVHCSAARAIADAILAAGWRPPTTAPRVFFPGDTVPAGTYLLNDGGGVLMPRDEPWEVLGLRRAYIELIVPSPEEWQAAVDRARADRPEVQP